MNKPHYPKNLDDYKDDPDFYEELALFSAQETIAKLMHNTKTTETKLAKLLNKPKNYVKRLLSEGDELSLKTFAYVCFKMRAEVDFFTRPIDKSNNKKKYNKYKSKKGAK